MKLHGLTAVVSHKLFSRASLVRALTAVFALGFASSPAFGRGFFATIKKLLINLAAFLFTPILPCNFLTYLNIDFF